MLKPLTLYMLLNVFNSSMILSALFEVQFSAVRKVTLDDFVWIIPFITKKRNRVQFACGAVIYMLAVEPLAPSWLFF